MPRDGSYQISIGVVDQASSQIDRINKHLAAMLAPVERLQASVAKFQKLSGLKDMADQFRALGRTVLSAATGMAKLGLGIAGLTGAGAGAAVYRTVDAWQRLALSIRSVSSLTGMSAHRVQVAENTARLMGVTPQAMDSTLGNVARTGEDAIAGRNPVAMSWLQRAHIGAGELVAHPYAALKKLMTEMAKSRNAQTRNLAMGIFGINPSLAPAIQRGGGPYMAPYEREAEQRSHVDDASIAAADKLREKIAKLQADFTDFTNTTAQKLSVPLGRVLDTLDHEFQAHAGQWQKAIGAILDRIDAWLKNGGLDKLTDSVDRFSAALDGTNDKLATLFHTAKIGFAAFMALTFTSWVARSITALTPLLRALSLIPGAGVSEAALAAIGITTGEAVVAPVVVGAAAVAALSGLTVWAAHKLGIRRDDRTDINRLTRGEQAVALDASVKWFESKDGGGYDHMHAVALAGSAMAESGMNPDARNGSHEGFYQWDAKRRHDFERVFGKPWQSATPADQLRFKTWELAHTESKADAAFRAATNLPDAVRIEATDDERTDGGPAEIMRRQGQAAQLFKHYQEIAARAEKQLATWKKRDAEFAAEHPNPRQKIDQQDARADARALATGGNGNQPMPYSYLRAPQRLGDGHIRVEVVHKNPPQGAYLHVKTLGDWFGDDPPKVSSGFPRVSIP